MKRVIIAGVGGQGVITTAHYLGLAATEEGLFASQRNLYGSAQRGSAIHSEVIISENPVIFPFVDIPDILICMAQKAFDKYSRIADDETRLYIDSDLVTDLSGGKTLRTRPVLVPATRVAEDTGKMGDANMVWLGVLIGREDILDPASVERVIKKSNMVRSFRAGLAMDQPPASH